MLSLKVEKWLQRIPYLDRAGRSLSKKLHQEVLAAGEPVRDVMDLLHGSWLGHPLHPVLTDIVVGSLSLGALFDLASALGGSESARKGADALTTLGTAAAVPTAVTGLADFTTIPNPAAADGLAHALLNDTALILYVLSLRARKQGRRTAGIALSTAGMAVLTAGAYLGGHLVFNKKVGVDRSERATGPEDWEGVLNERDLLDHELTRVEAAGNPVLLFRNGETVQAVGAVCPHAGAPLEEGTVHGNCVECPWHHSVFDLEDGSIVHGPTTYPLPAYEARLRNGRVEVRLVKAA